MSDPTPPLPEGEEEGEADDSSEHAAAFAEGGAAFAVEGLGDDAELTVPAEWAEEAAEANVAVEPGREEIIVPVPQPPDEASERLRDESKRAIEALVMVAEEPLPSNLLGQLLEVSPVVVDRLCEELATAYEDEGRGFQLVRVAGGWRFQSHPDQSPYVERMVLQGQTAKLSAAALETLAIVAYKQPISRAQVASIRGVSVDGVMRTLEQRGYIAQIGVDPGPGQALLFGTTPSFLEKVGLDNLDELPPLGDFVPGSDVVEHLERGLRPDRQPLRPEDAMGPNDAMAMPGDIAPPTLSGVGTANFDGDRPQPGYIDDLGDVDLGEVDPNPGAGYEGPRSAADGAEVGGHGPDGETERDDPDASVGEAAGIEADGGRAADIHDVCDDPEPEGHGKGGEVPGIEAHAGFDDGRASDRRDAHDHDPFAGA
jgi:segregation and condensation protein B